MNFQNLLLNKLINIKKNGINKNIYNKKLIFLNKIVIIFF